MSKKTNQAKARGTDRAKRSTLPPQPQPANALEEQPLPDEKPVDPRNTEEYGRLYFRLIDMVRFIDSAYPENHAIRRAFDFVLRKSAFDPAPTKAGPSLPSLQELTGLWKRWLELPEAERRRVWNGWEVPSELPDIEYWGRLVSARQVQHCLQLSTNNEQGKAFSDVWSVPTELCQGVEIYILAGTPKHRAIDELRRALNFVTLHFEEAIASGSFEAQVDAHGVNGRDDIEKIWMKSLDADKSEEVVKNG